MYFINWRRCHTSEIFRNNNFLRFHLFEFALEEEQNFHRVHLTTMRLLNSAPLLYLLRPLIYKCDSIKPINLEAICQAFHDAHKILRYIISIDIIRYQKDNLLWPSAHWVRVINILRIDLDFRFWKFDGDQDWHDDIPQKIES